MAQRFSNYPVIIDTQGEATNPTTATVMADTGALAMNASGGFTPSAGGVYEVLVTSSATATAEFTIQRRNAGNTATVGDAPIWYVGANTTVALPFRFEVENGERIRVMMNTNLTGDAVASITVQRVG